MSLSRNTPLSVQEFSVGHGSDGRGGAGAFQERLRTLCAVDLALTEQSRQPLRAHMRAYSARSLRLASLRFSPHSTHHTGGRLAPDSRLLISLHRAGEVVVAQGGRRSVVEPGQLFVIDPSLPFEITTGEIETRSVYLQRSALLALVPQLDRLTALPIQGHTGPGAVFRAALDQLFEAASSMDQETADGVADALTYLVAPALLDLAASSEPAPSRLRQMHLQQIRRFVEAHLAESALDADTVARGVNLSQRHVYELFSDAPEPLMKWVWRLRLERCRADLETPALAGRSIGQIAYSWGFNDVAHFSRAFKRRYEMTPRDCRQMAMAGELMAA